MHGRTVTAGFCVRSTAAAAPSVEFTRECDFTSGGPGNVGGGNPGLLNWRECSRWAIEEIAFDFGGSEGLTTDPHVTVTRIRPYISNSVQVPLDGFQDADLGNEGVAGDGPRGVPISPNQPLIGKWPLPEAWTGKFYLQGRIWVGATQSVAVPVWARVVLRELVVRGG